MVLLGHGTNHRQVLVERGGITGNLGGIGIGSPAVAVESHEVDAVVARIALQILRFVAVALGTG